MLKFNFLKTICHYLMFLNSSILKCQALVNKPLLAAAAVRAFNFTGHDMGQEPLVTEMAFCVKECVCDVQCQTPLQLAESLCASNLEAEQSSKTELRRL